MAIHGIPAAVHRVLIEEYRIDGSHSNAFAVWKEMGSPQEPSAEQSARLRDAGQLQAVGSPNWMTVERGDVPVKIELPRESVELLRVAWSIK